MKHCVDQHLKQIKFTNHQEGGFRFSSQTEILQIKTSQNLFYGMGVKPEIPQHPAV